MTEPDDASARGRRRTFGVLAVSTVVWIVVVIQVDRSADRHLELREARWWQVAAVSFGTLGSAAAVHLATQYGPWNWVEAVRRYGRDVALANLSLSLVAALYLVTMMFR